MASKRKADGSIAGSSSANLSELFSRLSLVASSHDYEKVVTISDQVLASSPTNIKAAKQKLDALIRLDKYSDALIFLENAPFLDIKEVILEKGYCLYKLGKGEDAEKVLEQGSGRAILHIRAQNAYRMEKFDKAIKLYTELKKERGLIDHEAEDIESNWSAACAQNALSTGTATTEKPALEAYEIYFNFSYEMIALGKLSEAIEALQHSQRLCSQSGLSGEELKAEQGIILTQLAYVKQLQENDQEALKIYSDVQEQSSVDAATRAVAINNSLAIKPSSNPFYNHRVSEAISTDFLSSKPFSAQSRPFSVNSILLANQAYKSNIASEIKRHRQRFPLDYSVSLIRLYNDLNGTSSSTTMNKLVAAFHHDETDVAVALLLLQVQIKEGNIQGAALTLGKLFSALKEELDVKYAPGLISLALSVFPKAGMEDRAIRLLMEAKHHWTAKDISDANIMALKNYATLVRIDQLSELPASSTHSQEIERMIDERKAYLKGNPDDISSYAILAALHSWNSPSEAKQYTSSLPPISTFTKSVDVKQLEEQGIPSNVVTTQVKRATEGRPRKRRVRGGKTFDPSNQVDPERWLPLRERSYYKPSKSKKKKAGGATQGGVESAEMSRNGSEVVEIKKPETATAKKKKKTRK